MSLENPADFFDDTLPGSGEDPLRRLKSQHPVRAGLVGPSKALALLFERVLRLADADIPVLVRGEIGSGKESVARALHSNSSRSTGPFIAEAAGALRGDFALCQLFGRVRGAYTGASSGTPGLLDLADGGTLFLDEVGDLPPEVQTCLVRVLAAREYRPLGSTSPRHSDFRLIAATSADLEELVEDGVFRRDLYFRLRGAVLHVPPLRDRREDILHLARQFLGEQRNPGTPPATLAQDAADALLAYRWPGNVRELRQELKLAMLLGDGEEIRPDHLQFVREPAPEAGRRCSRRLTLGRQLGDVERVAIEQALRQARGNKAEAARRLGLTRRTLYRRLQAMGPRGIGQPEFAPESTGGGEDLCASTPDGVPTTMQAREREEPLDLGP